MEYKKKKHKLSKKMKRIYSIAKSRIIQDSRVQMIENHTDSERKQSIYPIIRELCKPVDNQLLSVFTSRLKMPVVTTSLEYINAVKCSRVIIYRVPQLTILICIYIDQKWDGQ